MQGGCRGFLNRTNARSQPSSLGSPKACLIVSVQSGTKTKFALVQSESFHLDQKALCVWTDESGGGGQLGQAVQTKMCRKACRKAKKSKNAAKKFEAAHPIAKFKIKSKVLFCHIRTQYKMSAFNLSHFTFYYFSLLFIATHLIPTVKISKIK